MTLIYIIINWLLLTVIGLSAAFAQESNVFQTMIFEPEQIVPINGVTFTATQVMFDPSEVILNIEGGDSSAWQIKVHPVLPYLFYIKPDNSGSHTNLIVVTDKRHYYFDVRSFDNDHQSPTYAIKFVYPAERSQASPNTSSHIDPSAATSPRQHHFEYTYHGSTELAPLQAYDDEQFTYLRFAVHQPLPAVFAVTSDTGDEAVVNFRREQDWLIIHRVAAQFTLRYANGHAISLFNHRLIPQRTTRGRRR
jgi:type IV secretion system protein VirB9